MTLLQDLIPGLFSKMADTALSIAILGVLTYMFWKKLQKMEDAQAKYMAEDRARLLDVIKENTEIIQRNTEAFEDLREVLIRTGGKS